jgi:hypothetical protein
VTCAHDRRLSLDPAGLASPPIGALRTALQTPGRRTPANFDADPSGPRWRERSFIVFSQWRRVATRDDKIALGGMTGSSRELDPH